MIYTKANPESEMELSSPFYSVLDEDEDDFWFYCIYYELLAEIVLNI